MSQDSRDKAADRIDYAYTHVIDKLRMPRQNATATLEGLRELERSVAAAQATMVAEMRYAGYSWQRIGDALGITKQGAQKRYGL